MRISSGVIAARLEPRPCLQGDHVEPRACEDVRRDAAGAAEPDEQDVGQRRRAPRTPRLETLVLCGPDEAGAGVAEQPPPRAVDVAAPRGVAEHALDRVLPQQLEERSRPTTSSSTRSCASGASEANASPSRAAREVVERLERVAPFAPDGVVRTRERTLDVPPHPGLERAGPVLVARDQPVERGRENPVGATAEGTAHCSTPTVRDVTMPPFGLITWPTMYAASSETRKDTVGGDVGRQAEASAGMDCADRAVATSSEVLGAIEIVDVSRRHGVHAGCSTPTSFLAVARVRPMIPAFAAE